MSQVCYWTVRVPPETVRVPSETVRVPPEFCQAFRRNCLGSALAKALIDCTLFTGSLYSLHGNFLGLTSDFARLSAKTDRVIEETVRVPADTPRVRADTPRVRADTLRFPADTLRVRRLSVLRRHPYESVTRLRNNYFLAKQLFFSVKLTVCL
jgi:hypothetical protein